MVGNSVADRLVVFFVLQCNFHVNPFLGWLFNLLDIFCLLNLIQNLCFSTPHIQSWFNKVQSSELNIYKTQRPTLDVDLLIFCDETRQLLLNSITFTWKTMSWSSFNFSTGASTLHWETGVFSLIKFWLISPSLSCRHHVGSVTSFWSNDIWIFTRDSLWKSCCCAAWTLRT